MAQPRSQHADNLKPPRSNQTDHTGRIVDARHEDDELRPDADANQDRNSVDCVNVSGRNVKFEIHGVRYFLKPKEIVKLHRSYALPRKMQKDRDAIPSVVEMQTGKQVLACNDPRAAQVMANINNH